MKPASDIFSNETPEALDRAGRGNELGDVDPATGIGDEAKTQRAAGLVRALIEDAIHLRGQTAEGRQELTQAVRPVVAVDVDELDARTGHAIVDAERLRLQPRRSPRRPAERLPVERLWILAVRAIGAITDVNGDQVATVERGDTVGVGGRDGIRVERRFVLRRLLPA